MENLPHFNSKDITLGKTVFFLHSDQLLLGSRSDLRKSFVATNPCRLFSALSGKTVKEQAISFSSPLFDWEENLVMTKTIFENEQPIVENFTTILDQYLRHLS
jgi:hypothetical protein